MLHVDTINEYYEQLCERADINPRSIFHANYKFVKQLQETVRESLMMNDFNDQLPMSAFYPLYYTLEKMRKELIGE